MSTNENSPLPREMSADPVITVHPSQVVAPASAWLPAAGQASPETSGLPLAIIFAAVRRRWMAITAASLVGGAALGLAAWFLIGPQYTATATLLVNPSASGSKIVFTTPKNSADANVPEAFQIYKETQQNLLKSTWVLTTALGDDAIKGLPCVRREDERHNAVTWLTRELRVGSPGRNTAIVAVSLQRPIPEDAALLVNAVVRAYMHEIIDSEQLQRQNRLSQLQQLYSDKENDARSRRAQLKEAAERLGTSAGDTDAISLKQKIAVETYSDYRRELDQVRLQLGRAKGQLLAGQAFLQQVGTMEIAEAEILTLAQNDPTWRALSERRVWQQMLASMNKNMVRPGKGGYIERSQLELEAVDAQFKVMGEEFEKKVRALRRVEVLKEIRKLETEVAVLTEQEQQSEKEVERLRREAEQISRSSTDIEMQRAELKRLDQTFGAIADERQKLEVELPSAPRVKILGNSEHPAELPESEANWMVRLAIALFSGLVGIGVPAIGIVFWDARFQRVGDSEEVSKKLGLTVLGSVPRIPAGVLRRLGSPSKRNQAWRMRLTEAVDSLAARLLRRAEMEGARVVLVSSASAGEGKTTLATQLGMSLARHQRRTVLVDFDLRRPTLDGIFGMSLEPGVCEFLRSAGAVHPTTRPTAVEHLAVMTAGHWDRQTLAALANGAAKTLLDQLRAEYEFVVIDSSPILPVADTRLVSQHVDTVVLSVFRDVSQGPKVLAAYEILEAFGVQRIEAVVTGGQEHFYGKDADYEPTPAAPESPDAGLEPDAGPSDAAE